MTESTEPVTYEHVDQLVLSDYSDPTLIRRRDGSLDVVAGNLGTWGVICTRTTYESFARGEDTVRMRVNFAAHLNGGVIADPAEWMRP